jgi:ubiquinol-cytochrome c reductase cytochrome b/c1 subunit
MWSAKTIQRSRVHDKDVVAFTPYATIKDGFLIGVFCIVFAWFIFYIPNYLLSPDNFDPANPGQTPTRSANYRPLYRQFLFIFFGAVIGLGYLGAREPTGGYVIAARILTIYYFAFFFVILPLLGLFEKTKPLPNSISESVLQHGISADGSAPPPPRARG